MKIIISRYSGFCFGVKRAVGLTEAKLKKEPKLCSLGPIIHNKRVISRLASAGLKVVRDFDNVPDGSCVILPSHGVDEKKLRRYKKLNFVDTTCPFVYNAQLLIEELTSSGYELVIVGDRNHTEVRTFVALSKSKVKVVETPEEAVQLNIRASKIALVSQTTQSLENFTAVVAKLAQKQFKELRIFNTICKDVIDRQSEAKEIADKVDLMIVVGGKNSANTKRLARVCGSLVKTHHIEDAKGLKREWFRRVKRVGIVTGASTPGEFIDDVVLRIKTIDKAKRTDLSTRGVKTP